MKDEKEQKYLDNHANQLNPNNEKFEEDTKSSDKHDYNNDNRANQMNPNNDRYQGKSRK